MTAAPAPLRPMQLWSSWEPALLAFSPRADLLSSLCRQYMRMMGVHPAVHFLAWLLENVAVLTVSSAALALVLKVSGVFTYSSAWIIFLFLLDFGVSVATLSYLLSALFSRASMAALCSSLLYTASFLPYIVLLVLHDQMGVILQTVLVSV